MEEMGKTLEFRKLLSLLLILLLLLGIGYKVFEWGTLSKLSGLNSKTISEELSITESTSKVSNELGDLLSDYSSEDFDLEKALSLTDEIEGKTNLAISTLDEYIKVLEKNKARYQTLQLSAKLLSGKRGIIARKILENQIKYYDEEISSAKEDLIVGYLLKNLFAVVLKDRLIMEDFDSRASISPEANYLKYFSDIANLEKYTRSDFKFQEEDRVRGLFPYGYETLDKNREYMSSYYLVVKDYVAGDYESAAYKSSRLDKAGIELNIDFDRLLSEGNERSREREKKIMEYVVIKNEGVKEFKEKNLGIYPLLRKIEKWGDDLELCQIYSYKARYYENILKKYPEAIDVGGLLEELAQLSPSTSSVDVKFNRDVLVFTNNDEVMKFECRDEESGRVLTFETKKYPEED